MLGIEAAAEKQLDAGSYIAVAYGEKGRDGSFELSLFSSSAALEADVAGFDIIKLSKEKSKTPLDKVFTTPFADIQLAERAGQGQLGIVYRGTLGGNQEVAVKRYTLLDANDREYFKKEVSILRYGTSFGLFILLTLMQASKARQCGSILWRQLI